MIREAVGIEPPAPKDEVEPRSIIKEGLGSFFKSAHRTFQTRRIDLLGRDLAKYEKKEVEPEVGLRISKPFSASSRGGLLQVDIERDYERQGLTKLRRITIARDGLMDEFSYVTVTESSYRDSVAMETDENQLVFDSRNEVNELSLSTIVHDLQLADRALRQKKQ